MVTEIVEIFSQEMPRLQTFVEQSLEIRLGEITLRNKKDYPTYEQQHLAFINEFVKQDPIYNSVPMLHKSIVQEILTQVFNPLSSPSLIAVAGTKAIYYGSRQEYESWAKEHNEEPLTENNILHALLHELYHLALPQYAGYDLIFPFNRDLNAGAVSEYVISGQLHEGIADVMAREAAHQLGIKTTLKPYDRYVTETKELFSRLNPTAPMTLINTARLAKNLAERGKNHDKCTAGFPGKPLFAFALSALPASATTTFAPQAMLEK